MAAPRAEEAAGRRRALGLVLAGRWRTGAAEAVLVGMVALVAAAVLSAAWLAQGAANASAPALERAIGAPRYLAQVPSQDYGRVARGLVGSGAFTRLGPEVLEMPGTLSAPGRNLPASVLVATGLPSWAHLLSGTARPRGPVAWVERGAAAALSARPGSVVTVHTAFGVQDLRVAGTFGDLAHGEYPVHATASVVVDVAAAPGLGARPRPGVSALLGLWSTGPGGPARSALSALLGPDGRWEALSGVPHQFAVIVDLIVGLLVVFALAALLALVLLVAAMVYLELLRRERWVGQLRAMGWTAGSVRWALALEWAPVAVLGGVAGVAAGTVLATPVALPMTRLFGATPYLPDRVQTAAAVVCIVVVATVATAVVATRRIGDLPISQQLRAVSADPPVSRAGRLSRGGASVRVGLAMLAGRKRRALSVSLVTFLAALIAVLGTSLSSVAAQVGHNPAMWGIRFDWEVQLPAPAGAPSPSALVAEVPAALAAVRRVPGVASAVPVYFGNAAVAGTEGGGQLMLVEGAFFSPRLVAGHRVEGADQVEVGQQVAPLAGSGGRLVLGAGRAKVALSVAGTVEDLFDQGDIILGSPALARRLLPDLNGTGVLVKCAGPADCAAVGARLRAADHGAWAVSSAADEMALPFGGSVAAVTNDLFIAFVLLAALAGLYSGLATAGETAPTYGLLRAVGAGRGRTVATGLVVATVMTVPAAALALAAGVPLSGIVLGAASSSIGGLPASAISVWSAAWAALLVAVVACAGVGAPLVVSARRAPARAMTSLG
jgi:hypothetical protein